MGMSSAVPRIRGTPGTATSSSSSISSTGSTAMTSRSSATSASVSLPVPAPRSSTRTASPMSHAIASIG